MAQIINVAEIAKTLDETKEMLAKMREAGVPKQTPTALTESLTKQPTFNYKKQLVEGFKDLSQDQFAYSKMTREGALISEIKEAELRKVLFDRQEKDKELVERGLLKESIGLVSGTAAVPTIWASDVFRCCPYPASAFWDAPFIKWHEDIHGSSKRSLKYRRCIHSQICT